MTTLEYKKCTKCQTERPINDYHTGNNQVKVSRCKLCKNRANKTRYENNLKLKTMCVLCNKLVAPYDMNRHNKTKKHLSYMKT